MKNKKIKFPGYKPITVKELSSLSDDELKDILSICWHEGEFRCETVGIYDVNIIKYTDGHYDVEWSDDDGDPRIYVESTDELIDDIGDGEWNYGLYKKI